MIDWTFRVSSLPGFAADMDAFCTAFEYTPFTQDGAISPVVMKSLARLDFDVIDHLMVGDVDQGTHVNVRATERPDVDFPTAVASLTLLDGQLRGFFATLPTVTNEAPAPYAGTFVWHTTGSTTMVDPAPQFPKRVWASTTGTT